MLYFAARPGGRLVSQGIWGEGSSRCCLKRECRLLPVPADFRGQQVGRASVGWQLVLLQGLVSSSCIQQVR